MHLDSWPGRSPVCRWPCCSRMGRRAFIPSSVAVYSCFQQVSRRPQLKHRLSWVLSMTQRKVSHRRGNASYTAFTVSASEERLSATASSRVAAAESRGGSSGGAGASGTGVSQCFGKKAGAARPSPALRSRGRAVPEAGTQSTPSTHPPAQAARVSARRPGISRTAAAVPQQSPTAAGAREGSAAQSAAPVKAAKASAGFSCPRQQRAASTMAQAAAPRQRGPKRSPPSAAATAEAASRVPKPGFSGGKRCSA